MAHALHPNYPDKHEEYHRPELQKGLVIKHNANQRYATSAVTAFLFKEIARIHNLPVQVFFNFFAFKQWLEHSLCCNLQLPLFAQLVVLFGGFVELTMIHFSLLSISSKILSDM
jgi:hypothetical protein